MTKELKISDVYSSYLDDIERLEKENKKLKEQLEIALSVLGQIAMFSSDKADAVHCAKAIKEINEVV